MRGAFTKVTLCGALTCEVQARKLTQLGLIRAQDRKKPNGARRTDI
jgi:hypothetical protein